MSLLMKALKSVERPPSGPDSLPHSGASEGAPPAPAQAAADLIRAHGEGSENRRLLVLLILLVAVVLGLGGYFYVAVYMPWLLVPRPPAAAAPPGPVTNGPAAPAQPLTAPPQVLPQLLPPGDGAPAPGKPAAAPLLPGEPAARQPAPVSPAAGKAASAGVGSTPATPPIAREPLVRPASPRDAADPSPALAQAYALLEAGREAEAEAAYRKLHALDPDNPDVLLGLAVIAQNRNRDDEAARLYLRVLEKDGRNGYAQAALVALLGRSEPAQAEARLRALMAEQPAPYLYFALGNLLAARGRWHEAQQAYFEAQRLEPEVADYAFNLAVSLEHVNEPRAAAEYYRRALRLARQHGGAHFDLSRAESRLRQLAP